MSGYVKEGIIMKRSRRKLLSLKKSRKLQLEIIFMSFRPK